MQRFSKAIHCRNQSAGNTHCTLDRLLEEKDLELEVNLDQNLILYSDENLLDMVWNNLLSNAVKFTPEGGVIQVQMSAKTDKP